MMVIGFLKTCRKVEEEGLRCGLKVNHEHTETTVTVEALSNASGSR